MTYFDYFYIFVAYLGSELPQNVNLSAFFTFNRNDNAWTTTHTESSSASMRTSAGFSLSSSSFLSTNSTPITVPALRQTRFVLVAAGSLHVALKDNGSIKVVRLTFLLRNGVKTSWKGVSLNFWKRFGFWIWSWALLTRFPPFLPLFSSINSSSFLIFWGWFLFWLVEK